MLALLFAPAVVAVAAVPDEAEEEAPVRALAVPPPLPTDAPPPPPPLDAMRSASMIWLNALALLKETLGEDAAPGALGSESEPRVLPAADEADGNEDVEDDEGTINELAEDDDGIIGGAAAADPDATDPALASIESSEMEECRRCLEGRCNVGAGSQFAVFSVRCVCLVEPTANTGDVGTDEDTPEGGGRCKKRSTDEL